MPIARLGALAFLAGAVGGCAALAGLLPQTRTEVASPWHSFGEAKSALERIVPGETTAGDLLARGIDPYKNPNVQLLSSSDILRRFPMNEGYAGYGLEPGLRACLAANGACSGYAVTIEETKRDRIGPFLLDMLSFKRVVDVSGWKFNALVLMVGDRVVYTAYGGEPLVRASEVTVQPLGFLQSVGASGTTLAPEKPSP